MKPGKPGQPQPVMSSITGTCTEQREIGHYSSASHGREKIISQESLTKEYTEHI